MPLTAEERAEINRRNASKSTGPRTEQGKAASRRNALKHGLRAEALALPNEDPAAVAARADAWNDYYQPQSPAAQHMVNACVSATLLSDRCQRYHEASLAKQVRDAEYAWEVQRDESVQALAVLLKTDPATATRRLAHTADGCRWLIDQWERLLGALDARGRWTGPERDQAIRLQGFAPEGDTLKECPEAWVTRLFALLCHEKSNATALEWMFQAHHYPDLYRGDYRPDSLPEREDCLDGLRAMALEKLEPLRALEACLRAEFDAPDRAGAADRALILHDAPSARLFLRYHAEARMAFQRAYGSLVKTLDRDAAEAETETAAPADSPDEPDAPVVSPDEADSGGSSRDATPSVTPAGEPATAPRVTLPTAAHAGSTGQPRLDAETTGPALRVA